MLVTLREVLGDARKKHYAAGLFNTVNLEMAEGVLAAAEELRSPVIIGTAEVLLPYAGLEELSYFLIPMAKKATIPVVVHFDHGLTRNMVTRAMELGFSSVMYDCSGMDYESNIAGVSDVVKEAGQFGASVEAELGHVGSNSPEEGLENGDDSVYTQPEQAREFVERTGVDALAVAVGTAHGAYHKPPCLKLERLKAISAAADIPLVLHGGSGLSEDDFHSCIINGIQKINIFTDINCAAARAIAESYKEGCGITDCMKQSVEAVKQETMKKMKIFGSACRG